MNKHGFLLVCVLLAACGQPDPVGKAAPLPAMHEVPALENVPKPNPAATAKPSATTVKEPIKLDLSLDEKSLQMIREETLPSNSTQQRLPDLFQKKPEEPRQISVGGRIIMDDDEAVPLLEAIQGAEISIEARIR